jgi:nucleoid DNA-binding protein
VENFYQHIEKLLAQHDYVVVPNLGGFIVQMQSAQILSNYITPPLATIAFNPLMHHADGLMAIEIARSEQISYRVAMDYINKEVQEFKQNLKLNGSCQFGNLGVFHQNETGTLTFTPLAKADFLPMNFQLSDIHISSKEAQKKISITLHSTRLFKYAAIAMIAVGLFAISPKVTDTRQSNNAGLIPTSFPVNQTSIQQEKSFSQKQEIDSTKAITKNSVTTPNKSIAKTVNIFYVIVASSSTKESAERYCNKLAANGFPDSQVLPPAKTFRVAVQSYSNREEAVEYMEKLRETDSQFESAWVLCPNKN